MAGTAFHVIIPARMASTRLPDKPLADIAGLPMVVRVARQAELSRASSVTVACDDPRILEACGRHGVRAVMTRPDHASGSDRLAEACAGLGLSGDDIIVNVQGDEPLIDPQLIEACAQALADSAGCAMATMAHALEDAAEWLNPNVVKVVLDAQSRALYFSRAPIPAWRDAQPGDGPSRCPAAVLRHVGLYAYRADFLIRFPTLEPSPLERAEMLEQLRVLWHGHRIAVRVWPETPEAGVDTPQDLERVRRILGVSATQGRAW